MFYTISFDPGLYGAFAVLDNKGQFLYLEDLPTMARGKAMGSVKNQINCVALYDQLKKVFDSIGTDAYIRCVIEHVSARPVYIDGKKRQGESGMFSLGQTYGSILGVLAGFKKEIWYVMPTVWKKYLNLNSEKEVSRAKAIALFPHASDRLLRKKDHNRAEALLIGYWFYKTKIGVEV